MTTESKRALDARYLEEMRAHVDAGGQLTHRNAVDLLAEVEMLSGLVCEPTCAAPQLALDLEVAKDANADLLTALEACESWIADGGYVDDDDARGGMTGARAVFDQARAAIKRAREGE